MAEDYSYLGSGIVLIRKWGSNDPFLEVGNVSAFSIAPQTNTIELADYQNPGGGTANRVDRVTGYNLNYTFHDFNPDNFARATRGKASAVAAASVADEPAVAAKGSFVPLARLASSITTVENLTGTTEFEEGKDYRLERGMLFIPADSTIPAPVAGAANIHVTYQHGDLGQVEAAVTGQTFYEMQFYGANEARGGKMVRLVAHKVTGGVIESMGLIGNEFGAGSVPGALVKDASKATGPDKSAYFYWQQEK
ncbi:TPA: hypothetical protein ACGCHN_001319 [Stenotrophomonas maltophilia]|uniref:phage tail tube protein n=1 Tax=Stenotrophomonas maltophilia TaxID=40324 RepID=UPI00066AB481|nr:hypothetical protein [Stenotrophomonas maltophilia]MDH2061354.1 hypothetical protein [Stenotrophomonas maltophilia]TGW21093.1 hypothetical protein E4417_06940 [Stenotrophomonas maltophilia]HDX0898526.1 hypothetical protein [Stenotrophomonas maltophilia]HDX0916455.1 hypothetical protein [Stenotrophomonas maltophilia]HEL3009952.1 hypothetical protein [Stenotrophomonas maltophilia]